MTRDELKALIAEQGSASAVLLGEVLEQLETSEKANAPLVLTLGKTDANKAVYEKIIEDPQVVARTVCLYDKTEVSFKFMSSVLVDDSTGISMSFVSEGDSSKAVTSTYTLQSDGTLALAV